MRTQNLNFFYFISEKQLTRNITLVSDTQPANNNNNNKLLAETQPIYRALFFLETSIVHIYTDF